MLGHHGLLLGHALRLHARTKPWPAPLSDTETMLRALEQLYALGALNDKGELTTMGEGLCGWGGCTSAVHAALMPAWVWEADLAERTGFWISYQIKSSCCWMSSKGQLWR